MTLSIQYFQPQDVNTSGYIIIDGEVQRSNGRLDTPGATVGAYGFTYTGDLPDEQTIYVECTRIDDQQLLFALTYIDSRGHAVGELNVVSPINRNGIDIGQFVKER